MSKQPIGIFDSGVGGTSIWKEIRNVLPNENSIYLADSINAPYGPKGTRKIIELSIKNTEFLLEKNCKIIVVACNTATTNAISILREKYNVPFIGIEPAIKPAALNTKTKAIGILATKGTLSSALFHNTSSLYSNGITIIEQIGEGIVQLIENGSLDSLEMELLLKSYLKPMLKANIDYLVLGCTHYPYLIPKLIKLLPKHVKIIDSGLAVAKQTKSVLEQLDLLNTEVLKPKNEFYINLKNTEVMQSLLGKPFNVDYLEF
ncbi:glutamate racemase [Lacinutrix sp.]|uniref:glutamate racemase n=1 Tax=Lacinutrix sp. TaxID=1937692 RepID=UPI00260B5075|nr:glutamate racemase [Lacinutrix sp.]MDG1714869.1 glutamate racemase [Lacinutrix sp.]